MDRNNHNLNINMFEDVILNTLFAEKMNSVKFIDEQLYYYNIGGMSTNICKRTNVDVENYVSILKLLNFIKQTKLCLKTTISQIEKYVFSVILRSYVEETSEFKIINASQFEQMRLIGKYSDQSMIEEILFASLYNSQSRYSQIETILRYLPFLIQKSTKKQIKTIAIHYHCISNCGGIETYIENAMPFFHSLGYNVILITATKNINIAIPKYVKLCVIHSNISTMECIQKYKDELKSILISNNVDLFYTHDWAHWISIFNLIIANRCNCLTLLHYHNNPLAMKRMGSDIWKLQYEYIKYFDYCITLSTDAEKLFNEIGIRNQYMPNLISNKLYKQISNTAIQLDEKSIDILWVGRLCADKNINMIIHVLKDISTFDYDRTINVQIIGSWYCSGANFEQYKNNFLNDIQLLQNKNFNISIIEEFNKEKIYEYMRKAKVLLYTSKFDGYPYVIAESLANGLPIVAFAQPEIELFKNYCVKQVKTCWQAGYEILKILSSDNNDYFKLSKNCTSVIDGIYNTNFIKNNWKSILSKKLFSNKNFKFNSSFVEMIFNNI